jgi:plasmid stabilization system protein ParE
MRLRTARSAERELDGIFYSWAERASVATAERLIDGIVERFGLLDEFPEAGRACAEIAPGVRCFPAGRFLTSHRRTRRAVEILHVFDGAREQAEALRKGR